MGLAGWARVLANLLSCFGMLVVVPMGLRLAGEAAAVRGWLAGAVPGAASLWLPRGWPAAALAAVYLLGALWLAHGVPARLLRARVPAAPSRGGVPAALWRVARGWGGLPAAREVAVCTALVAPVVAAVALVAERGGHRLFGFRLDVLTLTVAHFHYAGFAAALVAGLVCRQSGDGVGGRVAALTVPAGTFLVAAGHFTGEWVELAGAVVLTTGMWTIAWLSVRRPAAVDRIGRWLLAASAVVLGLTMVLALDWALGGATGLARLPVSWMVATHGVANAVGFAFCGLLGWRRLR